MNKWRDEWDFCSIQPPAASAAFPADKRLENYRKAQEKRRNEAERQWPQKRVGLVKKRMEFIANWQKLTVQERLEQAERPRRIDSYVLGCVYLMWCPSLEAHKIGGTKNVNKRIVKLRQELDQKIEPLVIYQTPVFHFLLEMAIHRHLRHFHFISDKSDSKELFRLPKMEIDGFATAVSEIEQHILGAEILYLKIRLSQFEADLEITEMAKDG